MNETIEQPVPPLLPEQVEVKEDSLKKRYFYKLSTNFVGLVIGLITGVIIPRALGPASYGNYSFLTAFFGDLVSSLDSGASTCFYSKLSQRPQDHGLIRFYWGLSALISVGMILFVLLMWRLNLKRTVWPDQDIRYVGMAAIWGLLYWYTQTVNKVLDAYGFTVSSEIVRIQQKILGLSLILLMFWLRRFSLTEFFLYQYLVFLLLLFGWWRILKQAGRELFPQVRLTTRQIKDYSKEFYAYSGPLITYAVVGLLVSLLDRWLLQRFAGSVEQGFYGLSYQISTLCFLFSSAMVPLFLRDMSKAFGSQDLDLMRAIFQRYIRMLYSIAAFLGVFVAVQARTVATIFGGGRYANATTAIALMGLYPVYQTYGQLSGSVFFATGRTKLYRDLGIVTMLLGLPITYSLLAPKEYWGLSLGATGLALKVLVIGVIGINLQLWFNTRLLKLSFYKFFAHQLYSLVLFAVAAEVAVLIVSKFIEGRLAALIVTGFMYALGGAAILFLFPSVFSVTREELRQQVAQLRWNH